MRVTQVVLMPNQFSRNIGGCETQSTEGPSTRGVRPASNNPWMGTTSGQGAVRLKDYTCNKILPEDKMEVLIPIYFLPVGSTLTKGQAFYDFALQIVIG